MGDLEGWNAPGDLSRMRISDADRHRVAEVLRQAAGEGRLELDELDERLELTFSAKTYADLIPITADLYAVQPRPSRPPRRCRSWVGSPPSGMRHRPRSWATASVAGSGRSRPTTRRSR